MMYSAWRRFPGALIQMFHPLMAPAAWAKAGLCTSSLKPWAMVGSSSGDGNEMTVESLAFISLLILWIILCTVVLGIPNAELTTDSESPWAELYKNTRTYISWPQPWPLGVINCIRYMTVDLVR